MKVRWFQAAAFGLLTIALVGCPKDGGGENGSKSVELLNASYDPTRELWKDLNKAFIAEQKKAGVNVTIKQSHGASGSQARAIIDGLQADVATLALFSDTDALRDKGLIPEKWDERLPNRSLPYSSTIVFVVRKGNPKQIKEWADLIKDDVEVVTPNPKTSGNGKLSFLAAWGSVRKAGGTDADAEEFVRKLYGHVKVLDTGARGATVTFAQRQMGDVHLTWESEAYLEIEESKGQLELVYPKTSILAEPHIAVVDGNVDRKKTRETAEAYLKFLYTDEGQEIIAKHYYRPSKKEVEEKHREKFKAIDLFPVTLIVPTWNESQKRFFADGAVFDRIYSKKQ
ncbi:MAG: sulfate ABC transporter substrate-binding protein [Gemmataceae bacterium]